MAEVTLPQLGETVTEGTITQWFKQVGDTVAADEPLFEVSTDKVDTEVPSPVAGTLTEIRVQEGETVDVGTVIAVVGDGDGAPAAAPAPAAEEAPRRGQPRRPRRRRPRSRRRSPSQGGGDRGTGGRDPGRRARAGRGDGATSRRPRRARAGTAPTPPARRRAAKGVLLSPVVRRLVNEHGLDPATINGTGPGGRITRDDVLDHIDKVGATPGAAPAAPSRHRRRGTGGRRRPGGEGRAGPGGDGGAGTGGRRSRPPRPTVAAGPARRDDPADEDPQAHRRRT